MPECSRHLWPNVLLLAVLGCGADPIAGDWRDEVIYQIVVDRFDDGDSTNNQDVVPGDLARHQGGDWRGIERRLGYLERLGVTALWISPIVENSPGTARQDAYHGYWGLDFTEVNPRYGRLDDLLSLVDAAHARGMKVIVDVVTNHTGPVFFYDFDRDQELDLGEMFPSYSEDVGGHDASIVWFGPQPRMFRSAESGEPIPFDLDAEHFHRRGQITEQTQEQRELGDFPTGLRDLDTENEEVIAALVETYVYWVEQTDVDGFRIDAAPHVSRVFWQRFCSEMRVRLAEQGKEQFLLLGEVFEPDPEVLSSYTTAGQFDAVFDFSLKWEAIDALILDGAPASVVRGALESYRSFYSDVPQDNGVELTPWQARVSFADNHDMWRIAAEIDDPRVPMLAMTMVFTVDAIPAVYYGTEQAFLGTGEDSSRERLWTTGFREDTPEYGYISHLATLRRELDALRRGDLIIRHASESSGRSDTHADAGLLVFERRSDEETVLVAINAHASKTASHTVPTSFEEGTALQDVLWGDVRLETGDAGTLHLSMPPRSALILVAD